MCLQSLGELAVYLRWLGHMSFILQQNSPGFFSQWQSSKNSRWQTPKWTYFSSFCLYHIGQSKWYNLPRFKSEDIHSTFWLEEIHLRPFLQFTAPFMLPTEQDLLKSQLNYLCWIVIGLCKSCQVLLELHIVMNLMLSLSSNSFFTDH